MLDWQKHKNLRLFIRIICVILIVTFLSYDLSWAGATEVLSFKNLPSLPQAPFVPPTLKYLSVNEANPHNYFNFLLDKGQLSAADKGTLNKEARQLINYFFLGITLPDNVFWVNLKPAESDRITSEQLSRTDLGRTLLEQDFRLKRDVGQYLNPQNPIGRQFWERLYSTLGQDKVKKAGITTSNRVWIVPAEAVVVETEDGALLVKSSLKVFLESEYAALKLTKQQPPSGNSDSLQALTEQLMKEIVIPAITKDVNESQNYAPLRQIYHSLILAQWFKRKHKNANSTYAQAINKGYLKGLESQFPWEKQQIWQDYLKSYNQGEYKIQDTIFGLKRMYFSGGVLFDLGAASTPLTIISQKELPELLKQNPDLLNPESLKDSLVVITERQGNQENSQEQPLVQEVNVVSPSGNLPKETTAPQAEREKPESHETKLAAVASSPILSILNHSTLILIGIAAGISYIVYRIIKRFAKKEIKPVQDIGLPQVRPQERIEKGLSGQPQTSRQHEIAPFPQIGNGVPLPLRQEIELRIRQLGDSVAHSSKEALARSFRPTGPAELPLPIPISMLNQNLSDRDKIIRIVENMQRMMDGTDEKVLRDFERAIDNARDRVTEQALDQFNTLSDEETYQLLTSNYLTELQREFQRIIENQIQHMIRFHAPSPEEQRLYVSEEINERYARLPRYLKWLLTNNPQLEDDPLVREWLNAIQLRMGRIPAFPEMITEYSQNALNKSLYLNPELAMRIILYLARGSTLDNDLTEGQIRRQIESELARNLPDDVVIEQTSGTAEEAETLRELPPAAQPKALPAPDTKKTDSLKAQFKAVSEDYTRFVSRFNEQEALVKKIEADLGELNEGLAEARRQNDKVIIEALRPAVEGLSSKLIKAKENLSRLQQEKTKYEDRISQLRRELGETASSPLYAVDPLSLGVGAVFAVMFGIPLYITKKILNKWYNTTAGKTLGLGAAIGTNILGYYAYFTNLTPEIQKAFTDPGNAEWLRLATFFIIWPLAITAGIFAGKFGRSISHERLYFQANSAFNQGNIDEAINLINQAIKIKPKEAADYCLLAECQRSKKRFDEAIAAYKKALECEPNSSYAYDGLGVIYVEKGDYTKGIEYYRRSLEVKANDPIVLGNLGRALRRKGQLLEAARVLQRAQQIKPDASVTEELNAILQQTKGIPDAQRPANLEYAKTLAESLRIDKEETWVRDRWGIRSSAWWSVLMGWALGGYLLWLIPYGQHWNLSSGGDPTWIGVTVWVVEIFGMPFTGLLQLWLLEKAVDNIRKAYRFLMFPMHYRKLQKVNLLSSDELSDSDLKSVAPIYARMSKEYLEKIFRSWIEVGHEEKISRLFKFGKWKEDKIRIYADLGEYRKASRIAATKFTRTTEEQKALFDSIDRQKGRLTQKGISNAVGFFKDILPQVIEHSRNREEFIFWLNLIVDLPVNIWTQGTRPVLAVFNDLREFNRQQEEILRKFSSNSQEQTRATKAINDLKTRLDNDGLNSAGILKTVLAEVNKASRNLNEFLFWMNELMQFDKRVWSSGSQLGLLQNLIAYVRSKEEASNKLCRNPEETSRLFQTVDSLREELQKKGVTGDVSILKDIVPKVTEVSRNLAEFFEYISVLKSFDKSMWHSTQAVLQAFNNHAAYKQARENAAAKFTQDDSSRVKFLSDIDNLRNQLVQKGFPQASDLLKDILPELTKTCRSKEEFIYWLGELVGLNATVWRSGVQAVINNFNDLAGFKQAKEMALDKLCASQQEKDDLARAIDSLKAKLEEKRPSCAGLIKDVILEILKDIDSLTDPPYRRNDFIWWLGMCVNFEAQTWAAGIKQVLAGYQELKDYIRQRRELSAKFATNSEEQNRLTSVWDNLDKAANFTRPASISLLKNTLSRIAGVSTTPREFVFWIGTLSELNNEVMEVFCRDIETVFAYYKEKGKSRDFNHLPAVLNQYHKTYHQTVLITVNLLDILTDPAIDIDKRIEKASQFIVEQKIVKLGAPANLVGLRDAVSFEQLLAIAGEGGFSNVLGHHWQEESSDDEYGSSSYDTGNQPIRQIVPKMGRDGMYSYWEAQRPPYYQQFLEETKGLAPGFNRPGEKFRVAYDGRVVTWAKEEEAQVMSIADNIQALKQLIQYLRMEWPSLYDNFIEPKRELIKGRPLEEFITSDTVTKMAQQLLGKVQNWQFSDQQRTIFLLKIMEIFAFAETADLRARIKNATDDFNKLRLVAQYWERALELILKYKWLQEKSKFYQTTVKVVKQRIATINDKLGDGGEGVLQFYLSGGTVADFFRGIVSCDCSKPGGQAFQQTIGTVIDPGFFLFKIIENGRWIGNIYSVVFKTQDNKFALFVDVFQINLQHPLVAQGDHWNNKRDRFIQAFFKEFKSYLASQGFDYLIFASTHSSQKIGSNIHNEIVKESGKSSTESISLKKPGGMGHLVEGSLSVEYVQGAGNINGSFQNVSGYKISLDKTTPQVIQQKQRDLDYLEGLLGEMSSEENRLLVLVKERQVEFVQLNQKGQDAANSGKNSIAIALKAASEQKRAEIEKVDYEIGELRAKLQEKRQEVEHLRAGLGMLASGNSKGAALASSPAGKVLSLIPLVGLLSLFFAGRVQAQELSPIDDLLNSPLAPLFIIGGVIGFFGLLYYILSKLFPEKTVYDPYNSRPYPRRPLFEEYKLPEDVNNQLDRVLEKVSPEIQEMIPKRIDIRVPYEVGIGRNQAVKALRLLFSNLISRNSILDFLRGQEFYKRFKQRTKELGLADNFDQPEHSYFFTAAKERIRYEEDRKAEEYINDYSAKLRKEFAVRTLEGSSSETSILAKIAKARTQLRRKEFFKGTTWLDLNEYYWLLKAYAYPGFKNKLDGIDSLLVEHNYLEALSLIEEFLRVGIGAELISLESDVALRDALNKVLEKELEDVRWQFNRQAAFQAKKQEIVQEARDISYEVRLSERNANDILRGVASGDCTAINGSAFYNTIPQFLFDPGFLAFRVLQEGKWVGNVYAIVAEREDNPVLIIDAVQLPVWGRSWPISIRELADRVLDKVVEYAQAQGFSQVLMSSFVSNFNTIHEHFGYKYPAQPTEIEKVEGFKHLKALGLWDEDAIRNEYLETFSPQWNYSLKKVNPNNPKQTLLLRKVWEREGISQESETPSGELQETTAGAKPEAPQGLSSSPSNFIQRTLRTMVVTAGLFLILALPNIAHAAKFEIVPGQQPNQTQIVAVVEKGDNLWNIAGVAYKGVEGIGKGRYAAHAEWPRIYADKINQENILKGRQHKLGPQYPDTKQIVNIMPGDRLVVPGPVNYEAMGLTAPVSQTETKPPEVTLTQQQTQTQQELQNLQQQKSQVEQELSRLQQQRQAAQADLENLQKQKTELTRQILDLKKQLADIQEQLRQTKEKIPQTEAVRQQALQEELRQLEQKKAQYAQEIANLEKQYKEAQEDLNRITAQKEKASQELEQLRQQAPKAQTQIKDLQAEIQRLEAQKKQHQEEVSKLQNQRDQLQKGIEQLNQDKNKLQGDLRDLGQQVSEAKRILDEAKQKVQPTRKNIWDGLSWPEKSGIILLLLTGIGAIGAGIVLLKRWAKFKQLETKTARLQKEAEDLEARLGTLRAEEKDLIKMKQDAEKARIEAQEEAKKIAQQQAQLDAEKKRLEQEAADLQRQRQEIEKQKQELVELNAQKQIVRDEIEQLEAQRDTLKESLLRAQQETQEAISRARELEEQAGAQAQISQVSLTEEQQRLQEQLDEKRQQVIAQISALEEQLRQAKVKYELDLAEMEQKKAAAQEELAGLVSERDEAESKLREMDKTLYRFNLAKNSLLDNLKDLGEQQKALQSDIEHLKQEEDRLKAEVEKLKKVEEIKPEVKSFAERVQDLREEVYRALGEVGPVPDKRISATLINQLRGILGEDAEITTIPILSGAGDNENIIVKINATQGYEALPQIILNAHKDIHDHGYHIGINDKDEFIKTGALDDRAGVVSILQSLRFLKEHFDKEGIPHGQILVIFTDLEEHGFIGAYDLKERYETNSSRQESLFDNTYLMITVDGPLDWETGDFLSDNTPFVIAGSYPRDDLRYKAIYYAVGKLNYPGSQVPRCPESDGMGDHHVFRRIIDKQTGQNLFVVNLRAPHTGSREYYHSNKEKTDIDEHLTPFALWLTESIIQLNAGLLNKKAGSAKGQGMLAPEEHGEVNEVISAAQRENRGSLIWGDARGWKQSTEKDRFAQDISWAISSLRRYPPLHIPGLGKINIPEVILTSNIILILPRNNSPPGLIVKNRNAYQIAHSGEAFNSIYIDEAVYRQLYSFEIAALLTHEAIELAAKKLARQKGIPWTIELARKVHNMAEEYEIHIVGRSLNGRGSRFDDRIEEILDFANLSLKPIPEQAPQNSVIPAQPEPAKQESPLPEKAVKEDSQVHALPFAEPRQEIIDSLRKLFMGSIFKDLSTNLPAKLDSFPAPIAQELKEAYRLAKIKGIPIDADFLAALALFFSKMFPAHANKLIQYLRNLSIYLVNNTRSTYGATLNGSTFYIQMSCIEDLLGRPVTVEEIYQAIRDKDPRMCVALFRIIIHEIGSAFFKLSHPANQDMERVFLAMLSKARVELSPNTQQEIYTVNRTTNLDNVARIDWAQKRTLSLDFDYAGLNLDNLFFQNEIVSQAAASLEQRVPSSDKADVITNPGGIDLTKIELTLKDEKFVSSLNPADLKILRAARALKQGQESLAVLYVHEVRLILKDNILSEKDVTQRVLLQDLLVQLGQRELLNPEAVEFCHVL